MRNSACVVSAGTSSSMSIGTTTGAAIAHIAEPLVTSTLTRDSSARIARNTTPIGTPAGLQRLRRVRRRCTSPMWVQSKYARNCAMAKNSTSTGAI